MASALNPPFNPLRHPICLALPNWITDASTWITHTPFAMALVDMLRPRTLVELGTLKGDSYCAFCQAVAALRIPTRCFAVDTWRGDPHLGQTNPAALLPELRAHHDPLYGSFSTLIQSEFDAAVSQFADASIDLLHIDGFHTYDAVRHDFETWQPKLSDRAVVLFHDITVRSGDFGVWRLWAELSARYPNFHFEHGFGLGVLGVGRALPAEFSQFLADAARDPALIRECFLALGQRVEMHKLFYLSLSALGQIRGDVRQWQRLSGRLQLEHLNPLEQLGEFYVTTLQGVAQLAAAATAPVRPDVGQS